MIAYIQQIARILVKKFRDAVGFGQLEEVSDYIRALREELDRLDPRDFVADARVRFIEFRFRVRRQDTSQQGMWEQLRHSLANVRATRADLMQRTSDDPLLTTAKETESQILNQFLEMSTFFEGVIDVLNLYAGAGSSAVVRSFAFMKDADLRAIVERDYKELRQVLFPDGAWKSTVIMAGSILEAILYDRLTCDPAQINSAMASSKAPKKRAGAVKDLASDTAEDEWKLVNLIDVSVALDILRSEDADTIHQSLRDYRNYVHPRKELRAARALTEAEAMQALGALDGVCNHLE
jgi:hypothetical protein